MLYLDHNATSIVPKEVIAETVKWINKGNPSASYKSAKECQDMMLKFKKYIADKCGFISYEPNETCDDLAKCYHIIFTSGASESNNSIIRMVCSAYRFQTKRIPHIVTSSIEHKSLLECVKQLESIGECEATYVKPDKLGFISPDAVRVSIRPNTALVSIMSANNETGAVNNIRLIGTVAHESKVPFHTDVAQSFGKFMLDPVPVIDAFSVSFHKLHGMKGVGLLVVKKQFIDGFKLMPEICGTQNCGLRGGTENIAGIAGSALGTLMTWDNRTAKNKLLLNIKKRIMMLLKTKFACQDYSSYINGPLPNAVSIVFMSTDSKLYLPNTLLLAVVKRTLPEMCNVELKKRLEDAGVIVSIGSACNTNSSKASHVLTEMGADRAIKRGTLRVSLGDENVMEDADKFVEIFTACLMSQLSAPARAPLAEDNNRVKG